MRILHTFLHVSDLHLNDQPFVFPDPAPPWFTLRRYFGGLLGHSVQSLYRLYYFWQQQLKANAQLIVTGDLTRVGKTAQFDLANQYLGSTLTIADYLGFGDKGWARWAIPGNHDHWPGLSIIIGPPRSGLTKYFSHIPVYTNPPIDLGRGRTLRFFYIDSDADIAWEGTSRSFAIGAFRTQLTKIETKLGSAKPDGNEVRVLCLHHSRAWRKTILGMKKSSRKALDDFIVRNDIAVLLTGHVHDPMLDVFSLGTLSGEVLEARCGTTSQAINPPGLRKKVSAWPNSLLVHTLVEKDDGAIYWNADVYLEDTSANNLVDGTGFKKARILPEGRRPDYSMKVWPRP